MQKTPLSIRIIYVLTSIVYYLVIFTSSFGVIFALGLLTGFWGDDVKLHAEMPFEAHTTEIGSMLFLGQEVNVELVEASGKFHFIDTPPIVARINAIPMLIVFPLLYWLVFLFYRFVKNVKEGKIFIVTNFKLLRKMGFGLAGLWLFAVVFQNAMRYIVWGEVKFTSIGFSSNGGIWYTEILLGSLLMLVLSHIFLKGMEIQEENELTI